MPYAWLPAHSFCDEGEGSAAVLELLWQATRLMRYKEGVTAVPTRGAKHALASSRRQILVLRRTYKPWSYTAVGSSRSVFVQWMR